MKKKITLKPISVWLFVIISIFIVVLYLRYPRFFIATTKSLIALVDFSFKSDSNVKWKSLHKGIEVCSVKHINEEQSLSNNIYFARFDPKIIKTRVIYNKKISTAQKIAEQTGAFVVINANFFDPENRPLGLIIQEGTTTHRSPQKSMLNSGIFCIKNNIPIIFHRRYYQPAGITEAIQSFPRLISDGQKTTKLKDSDQRTKRSGIAIDQEGKIIVFITDTNLGGISLKEMQNVLMKPKLKIRSALNLDGGRSSQFYLKHKKYSKHIYGIVEVPVFLGFYAK